VNDEAENEENDENDGKIAVFELTATRWVNDESFALCTAKNSVVQRVFSRPLGGGLCGH